MRGRWGLIELPKHLGQSDNSGGKGVEERVCGAAWCGESHYSHLVDTTPGEYTLSNIMIVRIYPN
jgi:hypothetical protein